MVHPLAHVTHPSTNQARRRVTSLIETNALPLSHATNQAWFIPLPFKGGQPPSEIQNTIFHNFFLLCAPDD